MPAINFGFETRVLVGQNDTWGELIDATDLDERVYEIVSNTIKRITEPTTPARLTGHTSPIKNVQQMVRAEGDLVFNTHATDMAFWIRQAFMDDAITTTQNGVETLSAAAAFTAGTAINPTNPIDAFDEIQSGRLLFDFAMASSGEGTLEVIGRDINGERIEEDIILDLDSSDVSIRADAAYTSAAISPSDPADSIPSDDGRETVRLKFEFSSATGSGTIAITGEDEDGDEVSETITVSTPGEHITEERYATGVSVTVSGVTGGTLEIFVILAEYQYDSDFFYREVSSVIVTGVSGGTLAIEADPETYTHEITLNRQVLEGLTMVIDKGDETPNVYDSLLVQQFGISLGDTVDWTFSFLGRDADLRYNLDGERGGTTDVTGFRRQSPIVAPGWAAVIEVNDEVVPVSDASVSFNNNLGYPDASRQGSIHYPKPVRKGKRDISMSATIDYSLEADYDRLAFGSEVTAKFSLHTKPPRGAFFAIILEFDRAELVGFPDPDTTGETEILQTLNIRPFTNSVNGNDEISAKVISSEATIL